MQISVSKIVGIPSSSSWSWVYSFSPDAGKKENLIVAITLANISSGITGIELGREVLAKIQKVYFEEEGGILERLEKTIKEVSREFSSLGPELAACVFYEGLVYFCVLGGGKVFLWRELANGQKKLIKLLEGEEGADVCSLSGGVIPGDTFLFGTKGFSEIGTDSFSRAVVRADSPQEVADELLPSIHRDGSSGIAGVVVAPGIAEANQDEDQDEILQKKEKPSVRPKNSGFVPGVFKKWLVFIASKLPEKGVYVRKGGSSRRTAISVGVILIVLLLISIGLGVKQKGLKQFQASYEGSLVEAENLFRDSIFQKEVNPQTAQDLFLKAEEKANTLLNQGIKDERLEKLKQNLEANKTLVLGLVDASPELFQDLSLLRDGVSSQEIVAHGKTLAVLDAGGNRIFSFSASAKEAKVIAGGEALGEVKDIGLYSDRYFALTGDKIVEVTGGDEKKIADIDPSAREGSRIEIFGGNIYLLSKSGEIWRYPAIESGFGPGQNWLADEVSGVPGIDFAIDGSIWVLSEGGRISRFTRGAPDSFSAKGIQDGISAATAIYTDESFDRIFILERGKNRIVEIAKTGEYQKQYVSGEIGEAKDIVVSKEAGKIFLLTDTKILQTPLK